MRSAKYDLVAGEALERMTERFWSRVEKGGPADECWCWTGATISNYASLGIPFSKGLALYGHVFAFFLDKGRWPKDGAMVCHRCDNRICVRPDHLYEGSAQTNAQDHRDGPGKVRPTVIPMAGAGLSEALLYL